MRITIFSGGSGGAKLAHGISLLSPSVELIIVVNTGDDFLWHGIPISPDVDTVLYTLSGHANMDTGWGIKGDSFRVLDALTDLGEEPWFHLGDRDLAFQILRMERLQQGLPLSTITLQLCQQLGLKAQILPMSDDTIRTIIRSRGQKITFQEYFVRRRCQDPVDQILFQGADTARPAPGVLEAIETSDWVILGPSNPYVSIGAILSVPGIRQALYKHKRKVAAVSPIVAGRAIKGPAAKMLRELGLEISPTSVCQLYKSFLELFIADIRDKGSIPALESLNMPVMFCDTMMPTVAHRLETATQILHCLRLAKSNTSTYAN